MPYARPAPKGRTLVLDRRTTQRFFLLRPDADRRSQRIYLYVLAVIAHKHGVLVHGFIQMSTHHHLVVTDVRGVFPEFIHDLHGALAMCFKCHRNWDEEVWNKSQTGRIDLETVEAAIEQVAYVVTNGIEAGMVERVEDFPGAIVLPEQMGRWSVTLRRPDIPWLVSKDTWPAAATLEVTLVPMLVDELGEAGARAAIQNAVDERSQELRAKRAEEGLGYLGAEAVCSAPVTTRSKKKEPLRSRRPTFAVGRGNPEAYRRKVKELRAWRAAYYECLRRWKAGERDFLWPADTWKMRVLHGVKCVPS